MTLKETAERVFRDLVHLKDEPDFRKKVMDRIVAETGCSTASAATNYNTIKKKIEQESPDLVRGLGRQRGNSAIKHKKRVKEDIQPDDECFTVSELVKKNDALIVGRCQSFLTQDEGVDYYHKMIVMWPRARWALIQGLGPNSGDEFVLETNERELMRHIPNDQEVSA